MELHLSTWPEVETYLQCCGGIILPLGSTEQHGPNGLIGTDALCASEIAKAAGDAAGVMVAPTLSYGVAPFNLGFAGTISLRASTFTAMLLDCLKSLMRHGFTHIYCLNGHGGNIGPAQSAFADLYAEHAYGRSSDPVPKCRLVSWWQYPRTDQLRKRLYADAEGIHATPSEVAMTQHIWPEHSHRIALPEVPRLSPTQLRQLGGDAHFDAESHRRSYPDGRIGSSPDLATPEDGRELLAQAAKEAAADFLAFLEE